MPIKIKFDNGHTVQFDSQPSDADIEEAYAHTKTLPKKVAPQEKAADFIPGALNTFKKSAAGVGNVVDSALGGLSIAIADAAGDTDTAERLYTELEDRKKTRNAWYDPKIKAGIGGTIAGSLPMLPSNILSFALSPFETSQNFAKSGETTKQTLKVLAADSGMNLAMAAMPAAVALPSFGGSALTGGAIGGLSSFLKGKGLEAIADKQETKDLYTPSADSIAEGILMGAVLGPLATYQRGPKAATPSVADKVNAARESMAPEVDTPLPYDTPIMGEDGKPVGKRKLKQANKRDDATVSALEQAIAEQIAAMPKKPAAMTPSQLKAWKETQDRFAAHQEEQAALARQEEAQRAIEERQRALEEETARAAGLDFNAAERARQQAASTGHTDWVEGLRQQAEQRQPGDNTPLDFESPYPVDATQYPAVLQDAPYQHENMVDPAPHRIDDTVAPLEAEMARPLHERVNDILAGKSFTGVGRSQRGAVDLGNNASGESPASLEALGRLMEERNLGRVRAVIKQDGTVTPLIGVDAVDYRPRAGEVVVQKNVGNTPWTILDSNGVKNPSAQLNRGMSRGQSGAIDLKAIADVFRPGKGDNLVDNLLQTKYYQQKTHVEDVIREALEQGPTKVGSTLFGAGGTMEAAKTQNKAIQGAVRIRQREGNIAEDHTRSFVFPLEKALRKFSKQDMQDFAHVLRDENKNGKLSMEQLASIFDAKSLVAYNKFREMQDNALRVTNEARELQGKKPITAEEAYLSSVWSGDFRMLFQDEHGRNVWALAAPTKVGLNKQLKALAKDHPEIAALKKTEFTVMSNKRAGLQGQTYSEVLDLIGRDTPEGQALAKWYETKLEAEGRSFLGQEKHFQPKSGTRGFIGDRPGKDVGKEAIELLQAQITQAKSAFQWAGIQRAGVDIKKILSNEDLIAQQPETVRWIREYWHDQLGINDSTLSKGVDDMLRTMGASPAAVNQVVSFGKNLWTTSKLAVNIPFALGSNGLQLSAVAPHLADLTVKHKANPIAGVIVGPILGTYMATGHILGAPKQMYSTLRQVLPNIRSEFWLTAMKYAEDNSIVARSIYDEAPIEKNFGGFNKVNKALGKTITLPETEVRGVAFLTYAASLKAGFNKLSDAEIFRLAEERVSLSMGDYREGERAMIFNKAGIVGNASSTLTTFPMNYLNGWNWAGREAARGNVLPIMAMFATQAYVAGLMGIPGFSDVDKLIELGKDFLASHYPTAWAKVRDFNLKRMALQLPHGETALYGGVSTQTGVGLTSRAAAPSFAEMSTTPFAPAEELASMAGSVGSAAMAGFSDPTKNAQAAYTVSPTGLQGLMETSVLRDQTVAGPYGEGRTLYKNPRDLAGREGGYARTPEEEKLRALGFRSQQETVTRDLEWLSSKDLQRANKVKKELPDRVWNALRNQDMDNARDYLQLYTQLSGKGMTKQQLENQLVQEFTASKDRAWLKKNMPLEQVLVLKRLRQQLEELGYAD